MQPDTIHVVLTLAEVGSKLPASTVVGAHFYAMPTMHKTLISKLREVLWGLTITNSEHPLAEANLHWIGFLMAETFERYLRHYEEMEERSGKEETTDGDQYGILQANALCYILLSAEALTAPLPNGELPQLPQSFLDQRHNARMMALEYYDRLKADGGLAWRSWKQLVAEMNDRIVNRDDITSVMRNFIELAKELPSKRKNHPTTVFDPRFTETRIKFYSTFEHKTAWSEKYPTAPKTLPPWSNVLEGSTAFREHGDPGGGDAEGEIFDFVIRPDIYQNRWGAWTDPINVFTGQPIQERDPNSRKTGPDPCTIWMVNHVPSYDQRLEELQKEYPNWLTRKVGGQEDDNISCWIGTLIKSKTPDS